ncbi:hypothetical protein [Rhodovulum sp. MB263]|uniref:hypothetical protein n=1 Tax=Rhodovulum sp. (strain MB263) TaxID=308754 RepID=UPI0009B7304E|nr:hypothetical protein [Rhodovulum sp. MB263]ARC87155.1 hypothetical protein B5V46_00155 [Rhodovulum sp. MB263]
MKDFYDTLYGKALGGRHGPLLVDLWREILRLAEKHSEGRDLQVCDQLTLEFLHDLREVEAEDWRQMCWGLGPTVYGAVGLSWCRGVDLAMVWQDWEASGFPILPDARHMRPARLLNPELMPVTESLQSIAQISRGNLVAFCAIVAFSEGRIFIDVPESDLARLPTHAQSLVEVCSRPRSSSANSSGFGSVVAT